MVTHLALYAGLFIINATLLASSPSHQGKDDMVRRQIGQGYGGEPAAGFLDRFIVVPSQIRSMASIVSTETGLRGECVVQLRKPPCNRPH